MSSSPHTKERSGARQKTATPTAKTPAEEAAAVKRPPLSKRVPEMTDKEILALHANAIRISQIEGHPKRDAATSALPLIEDELAKRVTTKAEEQAEKKKASSAKRAATLDARKKAAKATAAAAPSEDADSEDSEDEGHG